MANITNIGLAASKTTYDQNDQLVYELYVLTEEEIRIVEGE